MKTYIWVLFNKSCFRFNNVGLKPKPSILFVDININAVFILAIIKTFLFF